MSTNEQNTFAGLWVQHIPQFQVIVQFTQDSEETIQPYIENTYLTDVIEVRTVNMTLTELETTQNAAWSIVRDLGVPMDYDINIAENRVELYVTDPAQLNNVLRKANIHLPSNVQIIKVDGLSREVAEIFAGLALSSCTSGFSVRTSSGTKGITTAGHCPNSITYSGKNLPYQSGIWQFEYDVQWHTAPDFTVRNLAYDGTYYRLVYGEQHRNNQYIGEWVCKYGKVTGGGCGSIASKTFNGTFIRVHSGSVDLGEPGDSGGPWFVSNIAYGLMTGDIEPGNDAYYMAINYIDILGLDVLTN